MSFCTIYLICFFTEVITGKCYAYSVKNVLTKVHSWSSFIINAIIPFTLLIHMNYVIVITVRNSRKMFRSSVGNAVEETREKTMKSAENQLTTMLLLVTTLFFDPSTYNLYQIYLCSFCEFRYPFKICNVHAHF